MKSGVAIGPIFSLTVKVKKKNVTNAQTHKYAVDRLKLRLTVLSLQKKKQQHSSDFFYNKYHCLAAGVQQSFALLYNFKNKNIKYKASGGRTPRQENSPWLV